MRLYNTLTRTKEEFKPLHGNTVQMYSCGPTVYFTAHIGNLRAYLMGDILKKTLKFNGYNLTDVMNTTDVGHLVGDGDDGEDKVEKTAKAQGVHPLEIAKKYTDQFMADIKKLNITPAKYIIPATTCIPEMIALIKNLEKKGYTYKTTDGIYFDAGKFENYFELSRGSLEGNRGGARVDLGEKRNINDFVLWKSVKPETIQKWDSPWGVGCPGWHIECSAIAQKFLNLPFDIHTGGVDHIPVHHTNEIAQTQSATGKKMANFWFHNEFMTIDGGKMSKSIGNVYLLSDLEEKGFSPMHFRYLVLQTNYRTVMNFTFDALLSAKTAYINIVAGLAKHKNAAQKTDAAELAELLTEFSAGINNDLNTPRALAVLNKAIKMKPSADIYKLITQKFDAVLSLSLKEAATEFLTQTANTVIIPKKISDLANKRQAAKLKKDYRTADLLRDEILKAGYTITDTKNGFTCSPYSS
jgi:cysteinyl-tRNA synthetase